MLFLLKWDVLIFFEIFTIQFLRYRRKTFKILHRFYIAKKKKKKIKKKSFFFYLFQLFYLKSDALDEKVTMDFFTNL